MTHATRIALIAALLSAALAPSAHAATNNIFRMAGSGTAGFAGDGADALPAQLNSPVGVSALPSGAFLIADRANHRIRLVSASGIITTVAGTTSGYSGDNGPASSAQLANPVAVAATADGGYLIADQDNAAIRRVSAGGTITTVAGTGTAGLSGDGGPATTARIAFPADVAPTADGGFLIADRFNNRIRRVAPNGVITTVAGTTGGFSGDGGAATSAQLNGPAAVTPTTDVGFLVLDAGNQRVRRVSPGGTITTVAGTGSAGFSGDGGPATAAQLSLGGGVSNSGLAATADGGFVLSDEGNHRVRRVAPDGTISTIAGTGVAGSTGDGGHAGLAQLNEPAHVAVTADGGLLVAERLGNRVRWIDVDLRFAPAPGGPLGPAGPTGPAGAQGAGGGAGASASFDRLRVFLTRSAYAGRARRRLTVTFAASAAAPVTLRALRGTKVAAQATGRSRPGRSRITLVLPRATGAYRLVLSAGDPGGQRATDRASLRVKPAPPRKQ